MFSWNRHPFTKLSQNRWSETIKSPSSQEAPQSAPWAETMVPRLKMSAKKIGNTNLNPWLRSAATDSGRGRNRSSCFTEKMIEAMPFAKHQRESVRLPPVLSLQAVLEASGPLINERSGSDEWSLTEHGLSADVDVAGRLGGPGPAKASQCKIDVNMCSN